MNGILLPRTGNDISFPLVKVIVSKIAYKSSWKTKNEHFWRQTIKKSCSKFFSGTSGISYCSKTFSNRPGLWIALTPDRFGRVHAIKDTMKKSGWWWLQNPPIKKTHKCIKNFRGIEAKNFTQNSGNSEISGCSCGLENLTFCRKNSQEISSFF